MAGQLLRLVAILSVLVGLLIGAMTDMEGSAGVALWSTAMALTSIALVIVLRLRQLVEPPRVMAPSRTADPPRARVYIEGGSRRALRRAQKRHKVDLHHLIGR